MDACLYCEDIIQRSSQAVSCISCGGWQHLSCDTGTPDYTYLYVTEKSSWNEALQICENYGGTLARITSQEVEDSLYANFGSGGVWEGHPEYEFWIGLTVTAAEKDVLIFYWSDCTVLDATTTFLNIEGESHRKDYEYCMKIKESYRELKYKDCHGGAPFVCEVPYEDGCHFTEESGYYFPGPASTDTCAAVCVQSADCLGTVFASNACFFLSENQTSSLANGVPTEFTGNYTFLRKECISAQLITNPDTSGVINNDDYIPWLPCYSTTHVPVLTPSTTTVYPTFLVQPGTTAPTTTILPLCTTAQISPTSTVLPLSTTTELYPSTTVVPPVEFDINALSKIFINDVEITNATCILETVYIPKSTPCLQIFSPTAYAETTNCPTFPDIEYNVVCNTTRAKFKDLEAETEEIIRKLTVKPETTAAYQNKFKCAEDSRPSAQTMGSSMGVIFILVPALLVIISDLPRFYQLVKRVCKAIKKKRRIRLVTLPKLGKVYSVNTSLPPKSGLFSGIVPIYSSEITGVEEIKTLPIHTLPTDPEPIQ